MAIIDKQDIAIALSEKVAMVISYMENLGDNEFVLSKNEKWSAGQTLDHLIKAVQPLQPAFSLPKFLLRILFGKANRPSRNYDELVEKYKMKIAAGGKAKGRFIPTSIDASSKDGLIKKYGDQIANLVRKIGRQSENELDNYILPHPLLGKITLREMLFFTIYHNEHHLDALKRNA